MKEITFKELEARKAGMCERHELAKVETSPMINNEWHKVYYFKDGACLFENTRLVKEKYTCCAHGLFIETEIMFWQTEIWDTEQPESAFYYEKF